MNKTVHAMKPYGWSRLCGLIVAVAAAAGTTMSADADDAYIQSSGATVLNTGYFVNERTKLEIDFELTATTARTYVLGTRSDENNGTDCALWVNGSGNVEPRISGWGGSLGSATTTRRTVVFDLPKNCTVELYNHADGTPVATKTKSNASNFSLKGTSDYPIALFAAITNATGISYLNPSKVKIYSLKIWEKSSGEYGLVHDFKPCVKGDVPGFKDVETGLFRTAEDVTKLTAGGDVERISDDGFVETVNNDMTGSSSSAYTGGHYIDTGYRPGPNSRIEIDYALGKNNGNAFTCWIMKCTAESGDNGNTNQFAVSYSNAGLSFSLGPDYIDQNSRLPASVTTTGLHVRRTAILDAKNRAVSLVTAAHTNFTASVQTVPCGQGVTLKIAAAEGGTTGFAPIRIYGLRIYEGDALVFDYRPCVTNGAPGLVSGSSFLKFSWPDTRWSKDGIPMAGGNVAVSSARDYDAFALFNGAQSIDTGYRASGKSKFVVDFSFANGNNNQSGDYAQQFVFETGNAANGDIIGRIYTSGNTGNRNDRYSWNYSTNGVYATTSVDVDHQRRLFTIDALNNQVRMTPDATSAGTYNGDSVIGNAVNFHDKECFGTVKIGSNFTADMNFARIRLYRFTIWDDGRMVRDFVPCVANGVGCLYDLVEGKTYTSTTATELSVGGRGYNGAEEWIETPRGFSIGMDSGERLLTAKAVGATSYRWKCDGEPISGGEDGQLPVAWIRGGGVQTYLVTPVYDVFGHPTEGTSISVQVVMQKLGMIMIVR
ncbi:MAG: hypothetical protein K6G91_02960 [Kiritimatiellae bacterium]|nr:hypothetical protein [Kiritimatiellia bacterium]